MTRRTRRTSDRSAAPVKPHYCTLREPPARAFSPGVGLDRIRAIVELDSKWVNGTVLKYAFFEASGAFSALAGTKAQKDVFRAAVKALQGLGIGIDFKEVENRADSDFRVAFQRGDGHWSYMGRAVRGYGPNEATMNLDVGAGNFDVDTAIHELCHTIGLPHEHQNPNAGIIWDEEKVYAALARPPNNWSREVTFHNIIRKLAENSVFGSKWDPDSIMHYPFEAGLIKKPTKYVTQPLIPAGGLSKADKAWITQFYPPIGTVDRELPLLQSVKLKLKSGQQADFLLKPSASREYEIRTFGKSDVVIVLFEFRAGEEVQIGADDDSGDQRNALLKLRLNAGTTYVLRVRMYYAQIAGETAVMWW